MSHEEKVTWPDFKSFVDEHSHADEVQYISFDTYYLVKVSWNHFELATVVNKGTTDATDFETNYKPEANGKIKQETADHRALIACNRVPSGYTVYLCGSSDDVISGVYGAGGAIKLDWNTTQFELQLLRNFYAIGGRVFWEGADLSDHVDVKIYGPASTGLTLATGDYNKVEVIPSSGLYIIVPTTPGTGAWSMDLADTLNGNVDILSKTPIPAPAKDGYFNYDKDTNALTANLTGTGSYNLYDFDIDLHRYGSNIFGRPTGSESWFESTDIVGKLSLAMWKMRFNLTTVKESGIGCGVVMTLATDKNV